MDKFHCVRSLEPSPGQHGILGREQQGRPRGALLHTGRGPEGCVGLSAVSVLPGRKPWAGRRSLRSWESPLRTLASFGSTLLSADQAPREALSHDSACRELRSWRPGKRSHVSQPGKDGRQPCLNVSGWLASCLSDTGRVAGGVCPED